MAPTFSDALQRHLLKTFAVYYEIFLILCLMDRDSCLCLTTCGCVRESWSSSWINHRSAEKPPRGRYLMTQIQMYKSEIVFDLPAQSSLHTHAPCTPSTIVAPCVEMCDASLSHLRMSDIQMGQKGRHKSPVSIPLWLLLLLRYQSYHKSQIRTSETAFWVIPLTPPWNERRLGAGDYASVARIFPQDFHSWLEWTRLTFSPPRS